MQAEQSHGNKLSLVQQWLALTVWQRLIVLVVISAFSTLLVSMRAQNRAFNLDFMRHQFHLPADVEFTEFQSSVMKSRKRPIIEGVVKFTDDEYRNYFSNLQDQKIWAPIGFQIGKIPPFNEYASGALSWTNKQTLPKYAGDNVPSWGNLSRERFYKITSGSHICYAGIELVSGSEKSPGSNRVVACSQLARTDRPIFRVLGALDKSAKTLHMHIIVY